jgi:hypothetical protein
VIQEEFQPDQAEGEGEDQEPEEAKASQPAPETLAELLNVQ